MMTSIDQDKINSIKLAVESMRKAHTSPIEWIMINGEMLDLTAQNGRDRMHELIFIEQYKTQRSQRSIKTIAMQLWVRVATFIAR